MSQVRVKSESYARSKACWVAVGKLSIEELKYSTTFTKQGRIVEIRQNLDIEFFHDHNTMSFILKGYITRTAYRGPFPWTLGKCYSPKMFPARDRSGKMTEIVDCIQSIEYSSRFPSAAKIQTNYDFDGDVVRLPRYRNPV
ncbi:hypothetical protein AVEN_111804-1 [Araneus ventricosus]|uniref:Uncharacterized protein n=1 Tax=Araneus ventricosus TaxID=182803 RepID=A0A4Y2JUC3_ARAVE|nr:hypothetical protein AVEN_111804-1 [Araneus ventricosus]